MARQESKAWPDYTTAVRAQFYVAGQLKAAALECLQAPLSQLWQAVHKAFV